MTKKSEALTLTKVVHDNLRSDILAGKIPTGTPLRLAALAQRFDVSQAVIREALVRLTEKNLVVSVPNQGFRVVTVSRDDLGDLIDMRILLECTALRESIERGDDQWEASVVAAHYLLSKATPAAGLAGWGEEAGGREHWEFHDSLGAACGRPRLLRAARTARDDAELYYQLNSERTRDPARDVAAEHREICELAVARDADAAAASLERHLRRTADALLRGFDD